MAKQKYSTKFQSFAKAISGDENIQKLATASIKELSKTFSPEIGKMIEDNPDILVIASNLLLCDHINLNGDAVRKSDILQIYQNFKNKPLDLQHDRSQIRGFIYDSSFSIYPTNQSISSEDALKSDEPIQLVVNGFLWKLIDKRLCMFLIEASNEQNENYGLISTSFELLFDDYDICVGINGNTDINDAKLIKKDDPLFDQYDKILKCNGGSGMSGANIIGRILKDGILPVGAGLVTKPASGLKGIMTLDQIDEPEEENIVQESNREWLRNAPESGVGYQICDLEMEDGTIHKNIPILNCEIVPKGIDAKKIKSIKLSKDNIKTEISCVNANINNNKLDKIMSIKINNLKELETLWAELQKMESSASVREFIEGELTKVSEDFAKKLKEKEDIIHSVEANKAEADKKVIELQSAVDKLNEHVNKIAAEESIRKSNEKFNERMANLDNVFDLDEDTRAMLADEVKKMPCEADDVYSAWVDKHKKLMKEKTKEFKQKQKESAEASRKDLEEKLNKVGVKATFDKETLDLKEVVASITEVKGQEVTTGVDPLKSETLKEQYANAFKKDLTIGGKTMEEIIKKE